MSDRRIDLSIVIVASDSPGAAARTVASLGSLDERFEVIVVDDVALGVAAMRRRGLDRARGEIVAFTEDSCLLTPGWADSWRPAFADPSVQAATGPVVAAMGDRSIDWSVFLCEYAPFLPGPPPGRLAGNNFALRRESALRLDASSLHEFEVPHPPIFVPEARAGHVRRYRPAEAIRDRLRFGREYGRRRALLMDWRLRITGLMVGPLVLLVQAARLSLTVARRGHFAVFVETLPLTLGLLTAWSVGEWLGWLSALVDPDATRASRRSNETKGRPIERPIVPVEL